MKLNEVEVILNDSGMTVTVNPVDLFSESKDIVMSNNSNDAKKIKTNANQVKSAQQDFLKSVSLNVSEDHEEKEVVEEQVQEENSPVYSFETPVSEPFVAEVETKPVEPVAYQKQNLTASNSYNVYDKYKNRMSRLDQLEEEYKNMTSGTWEYKTAGAAIEILKAYKDRKDAVETKINGYISETADTNKLYEETMRKLKEDHEARIASLNQKLEETKRAKSDLESEEKEKIREIDASINNAKKADEAKKAEANFSKGIVIDINGKESKTPIMINNLDSVNDDANLKDSSETFNFKSVRRGA